MKIKAMIFAVLPVLAFTVLPISAASFQDSQVEDAAYVSIVLDHIKGLDPGLHEMIISVDPTGEKHISINHEEPYRFCIVHERSTYLPMINIGLGHFLVDTKTKKTFLTSGEFNFVLSHELSHYMNRDIYCDVVSGNHIGMGINGKGGSKHTKYRRDLIEGLKQQERAVMAQANQRQNVQFVKFFKGASSREREFKADCDGILYFNHSDSVIADALSAVVKKIKKAEELRAESESEIEQTNCLEKKHPGCKARTEHIEFEVRRALELAQERGIQRFTKEDWKHSQFHYAIQDRCADVDLGTTPEELAKQHATVKEFLKTLPDKYN